MLETETMRNRVKYAAGNLGTDVLLFGFLVPFVFVFRIIVGPDVSED